MHIFTNTYSNPGKHIRARWAVTNLPAQVNGKLEPGLCTPSKQSLSPSTRATDFTWSHPVPECPRHCSSDWAVPSAVAVFSPGADPLSSIHEQHRFVCCSSEHVADVPLPAQVDSGYPAKLKPATTPLPSLPKTVKHRSWNRHMQNTLDMR